MYRHIFKELKCNFIQKFNERDAWVHINLGAFCLLMSASQAWRRSLPKQLPVIIVIKLWIYLENEESERAIPPPVWSHAYTDETCNRFQDYRGNYWALAHTPLECSHFHINICFHSSFLVNYNWVCRWVHLSIQPKWEWHWFLNIRTPRKLMLLYCFAFSLLHFHSSMIL